MKRLKKAYLEITNVCNLHCSFCAGTRRKKKFLSPEEFELLATKLRPHTDYCYLHLMGEPLLHPELEEILSIAHRLGFQVMITTNGTLLPKVGQVLIDSPAVRRISISVHSFEANDSQNPLEAYLEDCLAFVKRASPEKRCILRLWNLDGMETRGENSQNGVILERLEWAFPKPWREGHRGTTLAEGVYLEWGEKFDWPDLSAEDGGEVGFCYGLRDQVGVLCDGTVVPCCLDHEGDIPLGNLFRQSLEEILNSPRAQAIYEGFSQKKAVEELCRKCGYARRFR